MRFAETGSILFGVFFNIALSDLEHLSYSDSGLGRQINLCHVRIVASVAISRSYPGHVLRIAPIRD